MKPRLILEIVLINHFFIIISCGSTKNVGLAFSNDVGISRVESIKDYCERQPNTYNLGELEIEHTESDSKKDVITIKTTTTVGRKPVIIENLIVEKFLAKDNRWYSVCYKEVRPNISNQLFKNVYEIKTGEEVFYQNLTSNFFRFIPELSIGYIPQNKTAAVDLSAKGRIRFNNPLREVGDDLFFDCGMVFGAALNFQHCFQPLIRTDLSNVWNMLGAGGVLGVDFDFDIPYSLFRAGLEAGCTYNALFGGSPFKYKGYQIAPYVQAKFEWCAIDWGKAMMGIKIGWKYGGIFAGVYGSF